MPYKTVFTLTVLSTYPVTDLDLGQLDSETREGDCVGRLEVELEQEVGRDEMTRLLEDFGSDPQFFDLGDEEDGDREDTTRADEPRPSDSTHAKEEALDA